MICTRCQSQFDETSHPSCPQCGRVPASAASGILKSRTILISAGGTEGVYRSVKEVPPRLRSQLIKSTNGIHSATILIADRKGREQIARAIRSLPDAAPPGPLHFLFGSAETPGARMRLVLRGVSSLLLLLALLFAWLVFRYQWF